MSHEQFLLDAARADTATALARLTAAARSLDGLIDRRSGHAERLSDLSSHLWFLANYARDVERDLATLYAEVRAAQRAELRETVEQGATT